MASENLSKVEMNQVRGGAEERCCSCSCAYAGTSGGSSTEIIQMLITKLDQTAVNQ